MDEIASRIADNLASVRNQIAAAAQRSGRAAEAVTLVAVTKSAPPEIARRLVEFGATDLGESRPQELWSKAHVLSKVDVRWHLIGHLQRNKIRRTLSHLELVHSVDSRRLLVAIDEEARAIGRVAPLLLEVNISGDITKTGLPPAELAATLENAALLPNVAVRGLMGMAALAGGRGAAQRDFSRLRELRDRLAKNAPGEISLAELSMGMSGDFEIAIEEGATLVRVGSALFEGIEL
jgi:pyridoxal phosphate enzyme (YggS family)